MKIIHVQERKEIEIPFSEIFENGKLNIYPELQYKKYLDLTLSANRVILIAGKYIGLIPINEKQAINVTAKVPVKNFIYMLTCAKENPEIINSLERLYSTDSKLSIIELLINIFYKELKTIDQYGYFKDYVLKIEDRTDFKGRVDVRRTALNLWSKGVYNHAILHYHEYSRDVTINRAIYYTLWFILNTYTSVADRPNYRMLTDLNQAQKAFKLVTLDKSRSFLAELQNIISGEKIPYSRLYLKNILHISYMILSNLGIDLQTGDRTSVLLPPLVINMEKIFQKYLYNVINGNLECSDTKCIDTSKKSMNRLYRERLAPAGVLLDYRENEFAEPDFIISISGVCRLVCDVKYKKDYNKNDIYQILAHALAFDAKNALIIYPSNENDEEPICKYTGTIGDVNMYLYYYPLDSVSLETCTSHLVNTINSLVR